jgi:ATP-binding cassette subfamily B protein
MRRATENSANLDNTKVEGWNVIKRVIPYLWPEDELWVKRRVVAYGGAVFAKLIAVGTPILLARLMRAGRRDRRRASCGAIGRHWPMVVRLMNVGFNNCVMIFAKSAGAARAALEHLPVHRLSSRYHITRKTGGLKPDHRHRCQKALISCCGFVVQHWPADRELIAVAIILFFLFDVWYLAVVVGTGSISGSHLRSPNGG